MSRSGHFLGCDWGTSSFRLRLVDRTSLDIVDEVRSANGARTIHGQLVEQGRDRDSAARAAAFAAVLAAAANELHSRHPELVAGAPVVISGMASSTIGWRELPYAHTPCPVEGSTLVRQELEPLPNAGSTHRLLLVSGLRTKSDILRGEETEVLGLLADPARASLSRGCVVVLPGTHSKHVVVENGAITGFHTHMTGELLELLSTRSLLGASVQWPPPSLVETESDHPSVARFREGLDLAGGPGLGRGLFRVRVGSVLHAVPTDQGSHVLAGLLLGAELLDVLGDHPDRPIFLAAGAAQRPAYELALRHLGATSRLTVALPEDLRLATVRAHGRILDRWENHPAP